MNKIIKFFTNLLPIIAMVSCSNTSDSEFIKLEYSYTKDEMYEKTWDSEIIHNESILIKEDENGDFWGRLLYTPDQVICVRDSSLQMVFSPTRDYYVEKDKIFLRKGTSLMPNLTLRNIRCEEVPITFTGNGSDGTYNGKTLGSKILFTEGIGILQMQVMVTYSHKDYWKGKVPQKKGNLLSNFETKLENKEDINLVTLGDSIFVGANSTGFKNIEPFQDPFPIGFANEIKRNYGVNVNGLNLSLGGVTATYGVEKIAEMPSNTDLLIVGFGMNDASGNVEPNVYKNNIEKIINSAKEISNDVSIIVCGTILPSEVSPQSNGNHKDYIPVLEELENEYDNVAFLDMTSYSETLQTKKCSFDLYANNINHPADWLTRQYVANLMNIIEK